jgi:glycine cleavage system H protein
MWVLELGGRHVRIGMDPLGIETSGSLAQLSLEPVRAQLVADRPFGQLEAAKFVGPLVSPVTGTVLAVNHAVIANADVLERDPYGEGWLIEAALGDGSAGLEDLLSDPAELTAWFAAKIAGYRLRGVIAE